MAVNPVYFNPLSFQQANPIVAGMQAGSDIMANAYRNAYMQQQTQFFPVTAQAQLYNALGRYQMGQNGIYSNLVRLASTPEGMKAISSDPLLMSQYLQALKLTSNLAANGVTIPGIGTPQPNTPSVTAPNMVTSNTPQTPAQNQATVGTSNLSNVTPQTLPQSSAQVASLNNQLRTLAQGGDPTAATMTNTQQPSINQAASQNLVPAMQDAANSSLQEKTVPKPILQQRYYDESVNNMLQKVAPMMPTITQFAGAAGKMNMTIDKYAAATGQGNSPAYQVYNNWASVQMPILAGELSRSLGKQATDTETKNLKDIADPVFWKSNPTLALSEYNSLVSAVQQNSKALTQSPSQNLGSLQQGINNPPYAPTAYSIKTKGGKLQSFSAQDIAQTAQKYNMTSDQVIQHLKQEGVLQ